jgi:hypothetical protein
MIIEAGCNDLYSGRNKKPKPAFKNPLAVYIRN